MFDVNDAADLLALKNEGLNHPDYNPADNVTVILARINDPAANVGADTGPDFLLADDLMNMLWTENISAGDQFRIQLLFEMSASPQDSFDRHRANIAALDVGLAAAITAHTRLLSRGEFLFADVVQGATESVVISQKDWITAVNS